MKKTCLYMALIFFGYVVGYLYAINTFDIGYVIIKEHVKYVPYQVHKVAKR